MNLPPPPSPHSRNVFDLSAVAAAHAELTIRPPEAPEERDARLAEMAKDAAHRRLKDLWTFGATALASLGIGSVSLWLAINGVGEVQKWAMSLVTLLLGGVVGYWTGSKTGKN